MRLLVLLPGKLRSPSCRTLLEDYSERCRHLGSPLTLTTVREVGERSGSNREVDLAREAERLFARVPPHYRTVALDERGEQPDSVRLARRIGSWRDQSAPGIAFFVGSARGLSPELVRRADWALSLSRLTFPHEFVPFLLAEQLYRALGILAGRTYHR